MEETVTITKKLYHQLMEDQEFLDALMTKQVVAVAKNTYDQLIEDQEILDALKAAGVEDWEDYDIAQDILNGKE